jgi:hypothetical protein
MLIPLVLGVLALVFGAWQIFFTSPPPEDELVLLAITDPLSVVREPEPGEMTLERFHLTLEGQEDRPPAVAEIEFILHYHDTPDAFIIQNNMVELRDIIFRVTKAQGQALLTNSGVRRQLQADLLSTLNELPAFKRDEENRILTYVQISVLRRV